MLYAITPEDILDAALLLASLTPAGLARRVAVAVLARLGKLGARVIQAARRVEEERAAEAAKKQESKTTEPLLQAPDEHIVKALSIANEAI